MLPPVTPVIPDNCTESPTTTVWAAVGTTSRVKPSVVLPPIVTLVHANAAPVNTGLEPKRAFHKYFSGACTVVFK